MLYTKLQGDTKTRHSVMVVQVYGLLYEIHIKCRVVPFHNPNLVHFTFLSHIMAANVDMTKEIISLRTVSYAERVVTGGW